MMKTYKTWEVIKMISEDDSLEFKRVGKDTKLWGSDSYLQGSFKGKFGVDGNVNLNGKWELVPKPVDFITAINSGKKIKGEKYISDEYIDIEEVVFELNRRTDIGILEAINGKWFIMEGNANE